MHKKQETTAQQNKEYLIEKKSKKEQKGVSKITKQLIRDYKNCQKKKNKVKYLKC